MNPLTSLTTKTNKHSPNPSLPIKIDQPELEKERTPKRWKKGKYLPNATEAGFGIGFTSRGKLDSLPNKTTGIVLFHYFHHPSSPKRTHSSYHGRLSFSHSRRDNQRVFWFFFFLFFFFCNQPKGLLRLVKVRAFPRSAHF